MKTVVIFLAVVSCVACQGLYPPYNAQNNKIDKYPHPIYKPVPIPPQNQKWNDKLETQSQKNYFNAKQQSENDKVLVTESQKNYFNAQDKYEKNLEKFHQNQPPQGPYAQTGTHVTDICIVNGLCEKWRGENCESCSLDCNTHFDCCGDKACTNRIGEDATNCPQDCACGNGKCEPQYGENCNTCLDDCKIDDAHLCCGNNICDYGEDSMSCPHDCSCGDGLCQTKWENCHNCPDDCDVCQLDKTDNLG